MAHYLKKWNLHQRNSLMYLQQELRVISGHSPLNESHSYWLNKKLAHWLNSFKNSRTFLLTNMNLNIQIYKKYNKSITNLGAMPAEVSCWPTYIRPYSSVAQWLWNKHVDIWRKGLLMRKVNLWFLNLFRGGRIFCAHTERVNMQTQNMPLSQNGYCRQISTVYYSHIFVQNSVRG